MNPPGLILAYHGCDRLVGERVLSGEEHIHSSANDYDWLGSGAYFWENSPERALAWARFLRDCPRGQSSTVQEPFVIGAIVDPGECLDLTEAGSLAQLRRAYEVMESMFRDLDLPLPANRAGFLGDEDLVKRYLDCAVVELLHELRAEQGRVAFDTLRAAFIEGEPLYPGAGFAARTHIQWCVRHPARSIRGYFRPMDGLESVPTRQPT